MINSFAQPYLVATFAYQQLATPLSLVNCNVCVEVIGFKVAKSLPARVNARENPGPETGIPVGRA